MLTPEQGADGLTFVREFETGLQQPDVASAVDEVRTAYAQASQPQPEPEQQQQQQQDPTAEIRQVLEQHPAVRQALEQELASVEQSRAAYAQSAKQAAQLSAAAIFSQWPELASLTKDRERLGRLVRPDRPAAW